MRVTIIQRIQYIIVAICILALLGLGIIIAQSNGYRLSLLSEWSLPGFSQPDDSSEIVLISGHAGSDSGAICTDTDGTLTLAEVDVNASIAAHLAHRLRGERIAVSIIDEYDERLQGLEATLLLSLHSDSCIDSSGYKAARHPNSPVYQQEDRLLACLDEHYGPKTGLPYHPNTLTHDMFEYHAFNKVAPETPAVILEMGFMGGDQRLLSQEQSLVARGIADSILCFLAAIQEPPQATNL